MGSWGKLPGCKMSANGERNSQGTQGTCGKKGKEKEKKISLPPLKNKKSQFHRNEWGKIRYPRRKRQWITDHHLCAKMSWLGGYQCHCSHSKEHDGKRFGLQSLIQQPYEGCFPSHQYQRDNSPRLEGSIGMPFYSFFLYTSFLESMKGG